MGPMDFPAYPHDGDDVFVGNDRPQKGEPRQPFVDMYVSRNGKRLIRRYGPETRNYTAVNAQLAARLSYGSGKDRSDLGMAKFLRNLLAMERMSEATHAAAQ